MGTEGGSSGLVGHLTDEIDTQRKKRTLETVIITIILKGKFTP